MTTTMFYNACPLSISSRWVSRTPASVALIQSQDEVREHGSSEDTKKENLRSIINFIHTLRNVSRSFDRPRWQSKGSNAAKSEGSLLFYNTVGSMGRNNGNRYRSCRRDRKLSFERGQACKAASIPRPAGHRCPLSDTNAPNDRSPWIFCSDQPHGPRGPPYIYKLSGRERESHG